MTETDAALMQQVLTFWFRENGREQWFAKSDSFDDAIRSRFGPLLDRAAAGGCDDWTGTRDGRLALTLVLDQFSRNLFRDDPRAFAQDPAARDVARLSVALGDQVFHDADRKLFQFLPFEHSEALADQMLSLALYRAHSDDETYGFAYRHFEIIDRFGRFPHRNAALGRESTADELAFLDTPNSSF